MCTGLGLGPQSPAGPTAVPASLRHGAARWARRQETGASRVRGLGVPRHAAGRPGQRAAGPRAGGRLWGQGLEPPPTARDPQMLYQAPHHAGRAPATNLNSAAGHVHRSQQPKKTQPVVKPGSQVEWPGPGKNGVTGTPQAAGSVLRFSHLTMAPPHGGPSRSERKAAGQVRRSRTVLDATPRGALHLAAVRTVKGPALVESVCVSVSEGQGVPEPVLAHGLPGGEPSTCPAGCPGGITGHTPFLLQKPLKGSDGTVAGPAG